MSIRKQLIGAVALLASSAGFAASISVVPSTANPTVGSSFTLTVHGDNFPSTAGATLTLSWDPTKVAVTGMALAAGSPFPTIVAAAPWNIVTVLGPLSGAQPSGNFDAFTISLNALAAGPAGITLNDDQGDFCWTDAVSSLCVPATYNQANVTVTAPVVPVPAAAWLLMSALGSIAGIKRLRRS